MSETPFAEPQAVPQVRLSVAAVAGALGNPVRWGILRELCKGEILLTVEIAERLHQPANRLTKHMKVLHDAGILTQNRAQIYSIRPGFVISAEEGLVDLGHCLLRLHESK